MEVAKLSQHLCRSDEAPDVIVVQGDTSTTFAAALAGFFRDVRVAHVEAGLRTEQARVPFPEEMNRRLTTRLADLHLAPTNRSRDAFLGEGVPQDQVLLTGNTVVDALHWLRRERGDEVAAAADTALTGIELEVGLVVGVPGLGIGPFVGLNELGGPDKDGKPVGTIVTLLRASVALPSYSPSSSSTGPQYSKVVT